MSRKWFAYSRGSSMRSRDTALEVLGYVRDFERDEEPLPPVVMAPELAAYLVDLAGKSTPMTPVARPLGLCAARRRKMVDGSMSWVLCARDERHTGRCDFTRTEP